MAIVNTLPDPTQPSISAPSGSGASYVPPAPVMGITSTPAPVPYTDPTQQPGYKPALGDAESPSITQQGISAGVFSSHLPSQDPNYAASIQAEEQAREQRMAGVVNSQFDRQISDQKATGEKEVSGATAELGIQRGLGFSSSRSQFLDSIQKENQKFISQLETDRSNALTTLDVNAADRATQRINDMRDQQFKLRQEAFSESMQMLQSNRAQETAQTAQTQAQANLSQPVAIGNQVFKYENGQWIPTPTGTKPLQFQPATKYQPAGYFDSATGQFTPLSKVVNQASSQAKSTGTFNSLGTLTPKTPADLKSSNTNSQSILSQAGLSLPVFNYLTQGTASMARMNQGTRKQIMNEATQFLNKNGIDISTFQTRYKAYNDTLQKNIERFNNTVIMEGELSGTIKNLSSAADEASFGQMKLNNVTKMFAGQQFNDPAVEKYMVHLNQIKSEMAGYNAAVQGKPSADLIDEQNAEQVIKNGINSGSLKGFNDALNASVEKMGKVLQSSVDSSNKQVWDLFGVGNKFLPTGAKTFDVGGKQYNEGDTIHYEGKTYKIDSKGDLTAI